MRQPNVQQLARLVGTYIIEDTRRWSVGVYIVRMRGVASGDDADDATSTSRDGTLL